MLPRLLFKRLFVNSSIGALYQKEDCVKSDHAEEDQRDTASNFMQIVVTAKELEELNKQHAREKADLPIPITPKDVFLRTPFEPKES